MQNPSVLPFRPSTLRRLIDRMALERPDSVYLSSPESGLEWTYHELRSQSNRLGLKLIELGFGAGDKVAFMMDNGVFTAGVFLGTIYAGLVSVPLNVRAGRTQLAYMLEHSDTKLVFVSPEYEELLQQVKAEVGRDLKVIRADVDRGPGWDQADPRDTALPDVQPDTPALLIYTSGSTEQPKGVLHTQRTFVVGGWNTAIPHELSPSDRTLCVLPLYHINAESISLLGTLLTGGTVVMPHRFIVREFWESIAEYRCTWTALVPTIISQLLDWVNPRTQGKEEALERIRFIRSSSAPLAPALHRAFEDKFGLRLIEAMGSTECGGNIFSNPLPPGKDKIGTPGRPYGFDLRILGPDGTEVRRGETGEIHLRGPSIMAGYYKNPQGTLAVLDCDGWLRTGDLAYLDEDGYVFIVGRAKELIIKGGMNVAPRQIDDVLLSHPAVQDAAALGVLDHYFGEDIIAFVVLRPGARADEQELREFCEIHVGSFKTPTDIYLVADLPKGPTGKVQRLRLGDCFHEILQAYPRSVAKQATENVGVGDAVDKVRDEPLSAVEELIADTWAAMLKMPSVDVRQNFFALGGHSLLAIEILCDIRKQFSVGLSINDFFTRPTIAQQAALVSDRLSRDSSTGQTSSRDTPVAGLGSLPTERKALESILLERRNTLGGDGVIPVRDRSLACPLSPAQERVWFLDRLHPGQRAYNDGEAVRLCGKLDPSLVEAALNVVIQRHEVLRTLFKVVDGRPVQVVYDEWPLRLLTIDLSTRSADDRESEIQRLLVEEPRRAYSLSTEPGIRATLIRSTPEDHVLVVMLHHIVCDGWSLGILYRELGEIYRALHRQEPHQLPPPPLQYGDYATWQQQKIQRNEFAKDEVFWKKYLHGIPDRLELPTKGPRPEVFTYEGEKLTFELGREVSARVGRFSRNQGVSLFMTLTAAFETLLYRYTGQGDVVLGVPIANRERPELTSLFGFLIDFQALRTDLSGNPTFRELLGRVRDGLLDVQDHRGIPFDKVVESLRPRRDPSCAPLFQTMLIWKDRAVQMQFMELEGLTVNHLPVHAGASKYDLTLYLTDAGEDIWLEVEYCTDLFSADMINRMVGHFRTLLDGILGNPEEHLDSLPLLTSDESQRLMVAWNDTEADYPRDCCLHQLFEAQVERTPGKVAVVCEGRRHSYSELNQRADQLAMHLRSLGIGPGALVGIYLDRSLEMVVALFGVLKAGGAYLPLDPSFPADRVSFMIDDAKPKLVLTQQRLADRLPPRAATVVCIDGPNGQTATSPTELRIDRNGQRVGFGSPSPDSLAYVIYTSGSTGCPKGVEIRQRAVVNLLSAMRREPGLVAEDILIAVTTLSFDIAALELFLPLTTGASLVIATREVAADGRRLARLLEDSRATIMQATPATWRMLLQAGWAGNPAFKVLCGGEALPRDLADRLLPTCATLWNLYGPTETTIWSAAWHVSSRGPILLGRPIANTRFYVLDRLLKPVPVGVPGELFIGGDGLARGYLNRPDLTATRFVKDPFRPDSIGCLYRTGDSVRYRSDGCLEYLGRLDDQVKIRGHRIELGEVEAVLSEHPRVRDIVVVARRDVSGENRLVAYVVPQGTLAPTFGELRTHLEPKLPAFMIPSALVVLDAIPLTANGKLDRRALPEPEGASAIVSHGYAAPRTEIEERLAACWANALGLKRIGIHDNFFELGGHSLMATGMFSRIEAEFERSIPLAILFKAQTIAEMAEVLTNAAATDSLRSTLAIRNGKLRRPTLFLVHGMDGDLGQWRCLIKHLGTDFDVYGLKLPEKNGVYQLFSNLESMAAYHVDRICDLQPEGPYHIAGYSFGARVALEIAHQLLSIGRQVGLLGAIDSGPFRRDHYEWKHFSIYRFIHNTYSYIGDDILKSHPREILERVRLKARKFAKRMGIISSSLPASSPLLRLESWLDVEKLRAQDRSLVESNYLAWQSYVPRPYPGQVTLFRARARPIFHSLRPDLGWGDVAQGGVDIHVINGEHWRIMLEPTVRTLAEQLRSCLERTDVELLPSPSRTVDFPFSSRGQAAQFSLADRT
jgi:amino acid adenylation domain-containing protein